MRVLRPLVLATIGMLAVGAGPIRAQGVLDQLEQKLDQIPTPNVPAAAASAPTAGYLGLVASEGTGAEAGLIVSRVAPDGPAAKAGIRPGDQIVSVNGRPIKTLEDMDREARKPAGTRLKMEIRRNNTIALGELTLAVQPGRPAGPPTMDELPPPLPPVENTPLPVPRPAPSRTNRPSLGVNVLDVTPVTRKQYQLTVHSGAVIRTIRSGSAAEQAGLPLGGAIVAVDGHVIKSADDLVAAIQTHRVGDVINVTYYEGDRMRRKQVKLGQASAAPAPPVGPPPVPAGLPLRAPAPTPPPANQPALRLGKPNTARPPAHNPSPTPDTSLPTRDAVRPNPMPPAANQPKPAASSSILSTPSKSDNIESLRRQVTDLQKQLEQLRKRLDQLEQKLNAPPAAKK